MIGLLLSRQNVFGQGSLTPPGAPAPTMKTLEQVEPRTQISSLPYTITQAGSYYLTTNLTGATGITIAVSHVTLDLMGFELVGGSGAGISGGGALENIVVRNGTIRGWSARGIDLTTSGTHNRIESLRLLGNGSDGVLAGRRSTVTDCEADSNGGDGIAVGTGSIVRDCRSAANTGSGIVGAIGCEIRGCKALSNVGDGIQIGRGLVTGCTAHSNSGDGIEVGDQAYVHHNISRSNGNDGDGAGVHVTGSDNRIESNHVTGNDRGLDLDAGGNIVKDNTVKGNADNYDVAAGNQLNLLLSELPESIDWPAQVVLAGSLSVTSGSAVVINSGDVTLDLGGHAISSSAPSANGTAILFSGGHRNIAICNGHIRGGVTQSGGVYSGSGFANGISNGGTPAANARVSNVSVTGCLNFGIRLSNGDATVVESCTVRTVGSYGIIASTVSRSVAMECGTQGIAGDQVTSSRGECIGAGTGVHASRSAQNSTGSSNSGSGLYAYTAQNCYGTSSTGVGLQGITAQNCYGSSSSGTAGLSVSIAHNCYGYNTSGTYGLYVTTAQNCYGYTSSGTAGLSANTALNCQGDTTDATYGLYAKSTTGCSGSNVSGNYGLYTEQTATGCTGSNVNGIFGLYATTASNCSGHHEGQRGSYALSVVRTALNCYGYNLAGNTNAVASGLRAETAQNCSGHTDGRGSGLEASVAVGSYGESDTGHGLTANLANSCLGYSHNGTNSITLFKYDMP